MTIKVDFVDIQTNEEAAEQFVDRLATLSLVDWLSVAATVTQTAGARARANEALDRVIAQYSLAVDAWNIGDDVETAFHCSVGATGFTRSPRDSLSLRIAREAATKAAVALFVGSLLTAADFESLYRPFDALVPRPSARNSRRPAAARPPVKLVPRSPRGWRRGTL